MLSCGALQNQSLPLVFIPKVSFGFVRYPLFRNPALYPIACDMELDGMTYNNGELARKKAPHIEVLHIMPLTEYSYLPTFPLHALHAEEYNMDIPSQNHNVHMSW